MLPYCELFFMLYPLLITYIILCFFLLKNIKHISDPNLLNIILKYLSISILMTNILTEEIPLQAPHQVL